MIASEISGVQRFQFGDMSYDNNLGAVIFVDPLYSRTSVGPKTRSSEPVALWPGQNLPRIVGDAGNDGVGFRKPQATPRINTSRFPSRPLIIRVPFFLLFGFNKGTQKEKG